MNVATPELCKELYELSRWMDCRFVHDSSHKNYTPAYDLGYLLRKLPANDVEGYKLQVHCDDTDYWYAGYYQRDNSQLKTESNPCATPEEAACQLAINLFKEGVLTLGD